MSKPTAIFVLGHVGKQAAELGVTLTPDDLATLDYISEKGGVDAEVVFACEAPATHGRKPLVRDLRMERDSLVDRINVSDAQIVVAFGPVAVTALWNKGGIKLQEVRLKNHQIPGINRPVCVTNSLEEIALKSGLRNWAGLDVLRAIAGETPSKFGDYVVSDWMDGPAPQLAAYLSLEGELEVTVDLETYPGLDPHHPAARIRMVVVSHRSGWAQVVQAGPASEIPEWLVALLRSPGILKMGSNIGFDVRWLNRFGYEVNNTWDLKYGAHLLDENDPMKDLKTLSLRDHPTLGDYSAAQDKMVRERSVRNAKGKVIEDGWRHIKDEEMYDYAGGDGDAGITVWLKQKESIAAAGLGRPYQVMREYAPAILQLEHAGACVDMAENAALSERYIAALAELKREIRGHLGPINPASPVQLAKALQEYVPDINLRKVFAKKEDEDKYSTAAFILRREARKNPVIDTILKFRRHQALYNFVKGLPKHVVYIGGKSFVFSSLRGDVTTTYRHSSSHPNLQNLPRNVEEESEAGLNVKRQYISRFEGGSIMEFDQSQLELRETGMISPDQALIDAFASGEDIHTTLAAMMRGVAPELVTKQIRQEGKTTNFHVLYGGGAWGLSMRLGCSQFFAQQLIDQFDETFVGFRRWEAEQHRLMMTRGWVESRYGFRRRCVKPATGWASPMGRHIKRQAGNAPIQGGASIHTNLGIVATLAAFRREGLRSIPFLTVHDSLVVDVYPGEMEDVIRLVREGMEHPDTLKYGVELTIPLKVDVKMGPTWGQLEEI